MRNAAGAKRNIADFSYRTDQAELIEFILANVPEGETVSVVQLP